MTMLMMLIGGIGAILLGLPYIFHAFGPTEAEVILWGQFSICMGASLLLLSLGFGRSHTRAAKVFLSIGFLGLAIFQGFPILLWFAFHGLGISDDTPESTFVVHWSYSIPHVALVLVSLMILYRLWRFPVPLPSQEASTN